MKVYLVWEKFYYEASELLEIFLIKQEAENYVEKLMKENNYEEEKYLIEGQKVRIDMEENDESI